MSTLAGRRPVERLGRQTPKSSAGRHFARQARAAPGGGLIEYNGTVRCRCDGGLSVTQPPRERRPTPPRKTTHGP